MTTTTAKRTPAKADPPRRTERDPIWDYLARPFDPDWIEKLPKQLKRGDERKARCEDTAAGRTVSADGHYCGGWHARSMHLDYVGHAGITMRLNEDVGPENWSLEPMGTNDAGLPIYTGKEFWVALRILGVVKYDLAESFASTQEAWGDGLRRAAMRFGIGTALWSKSDYAFNSRVNSEEVAAAPAPDVPTAEHVTVLRERIAGLVDEHRQALATWWGKADLPKIDSLSPQQAAVVDGEIDRLVEAGRQETIKARLSAVPSGDDA